MERVRIGHAVVYGGLLCSLLSAGPVGIVFGGQPAVGQVALVLAWDPAQVIHAAGMSPIGPGTAPFAAFAVLPDAAALDRAETAGAWALVDGTRALALCAGITYDRL